MGRAKWRVGGKKSGLELQVGSLLVLAGYTEGYEKDTLKYVMPESRHSYTPDFKPTSKAIYLETKGRWEASDRKKMKLILEQHTNKIFIMIFGNSKNFITKKSLTTYGDYCDKIGLLWCDIRDFKQDPKACLSYLIHKQKNGLSKTPRRKRLTKSSISVKDV